MAFTQIVYHIVYGTHNREKCLIKENRERLYQYVNGILRSQKSHVYRLGGIEDHMHILISLHPTVALSNLIKSIKISSNKWIREEKIFDGFSSWQVKYFAATCNIREIDGLIEYIKNQEEHHKTESFKEEYIRLLRENRIPFKEEYLFD